MYVADILRWRCATYDFGIQTKPSRCAVDLCDCHTQAQQLQVHNCRELKRFNYQRRFRPVNICDKTVANRNWKGCVLSAVRNGVGAVWPYQLYAWSILDE